LYAPRESNAAVVFCAGIVSIISQKSALVRQRRRCRVSTHQTSKRSSPKISLPPINPKIVL